MTENLVLRVKRLDANAVLPRYANPGDAGMDLYALGEYILYPGKTCLIRTGIKVEIPLGYEMQIRPRSGLALKHNLTVLNTPGTIDSGYRGEVGVILINHGNVNYIVHNGEKVAQGIIGKVESVLIEEVEELSETKRGEGGFGSTGK